MLLFLPSCPARLLASELGWSLKGVLGSHRLTCMCQRKFGNACLLGMRVCGSPPAHPASLSKATQGKWKLLLICFAPRYFSPGKISKQFNSNEFSSEQPHDLIPSHAMPWDGISSYLGWCFEEWWAFCHPSLDVPNVVDDRSQLSTSGTIQYSRDKSITIAIGQVNWELLPNSYGWELAQSKKLFFSSSNCLH